MVFTAGVVLASSLLTAHAGSLAGSEGDVKRKPRFGNMVHGPCAGGYDKYIAASGHSAYVTTPNGYGNEHFICSWRLNFPSKAKAEEMAMKDCQAGLKKYKVPIFGRCEVIASK
jgi:hypothetical protein